MKREHWDDDLLATRLREGTWKLTELRTDEMMDNVRWRVNGVAVERLGFQRERPSVGLLVDTRWHKDGDNLLVLLGSTRGWNGDVEAAIKKNGMAALKWEKREKKERPTVLFIEVEAQQ